MNPTNTALNWFPGFFFQERADIDVDVAPVMDDDQDEVCVFVRGPGKTLSLMASHHT